MNPEAAATQSPLAAELPDPIIMVEDLVKRYPGRPTNAVDGLSFTVRRGEVFGLLGPNGAGKTTAIGVLTTRVRATSGRAEVAGVDVARRPVDAKSRIAVVPQLNNLDRSLSPRQNLLFHAAYHGVRRAEAVQLADRLLAQFGLGDRGADRVDRYSGGMAQRLMIARALMHQPDVLFLDEPTTGLDPQARLFVWDRVRALNREGLSVVLTSHDMREAEELCHRVAIVDHGRLLALDHPDALKRLVPGENTLTLAVRVDPAEADAEAERLAGRLAGIPGVRGVERERPEVPVGGPAAGGFGWGPSLPAGPPLEPGRLLFRLYAQQGDQSLIGEVARVAVEAGVDVVDIHRARVTLEDVFVHLTGRGLR